ncbi:MAG: hypothetical protein ACOYMS_06290 [Terrimicrobiaceae bacterium]
MKKILLLLLWATGTVSLMSSCTKTIYVDRTVYVTPKATPKPAPRPAATPRPRVDNPDNFDAVGKPTSYSY